MPLFSTSSSPFRQRRIPHKPSLTFRRSLWIALLLGSVLSLSSSFVGGTVGASESHSSWPGFLYNQVKGWLISSAGKSAAAVKPARLFAAPEIAVEQPVGTDIPDGGSKDFGTVEVFRPRELDFTIKNTGDADLTGFSTMIDGTDAGLFSVTIAATSPVVGGSKTTFTVRFSPDSLGAKTAVLHITNNDAGEDPFDITLNGTGGAATVIEVPAAYNLGNTLPGIPVAYYWQSAGTARSVTNLIANIATVPADRTWKPSSFVTLYPNNSDGLFALLPGNDSDTVVPHTDVIPISQSRFALRGYLYVSTSVDQDPGTPGIQFNASLGSDDQSILILGGGVNADPAVGLIVLSTELGSTNAVLSFPSPGYYQFDGLWQEDFGGTTFQFRTPPGTTVTNTPEIVVEQPVNTSITSGSTNSFGTTSVGGTITQTFTIRNSGVLDLTSLAITKDGTEAAEFTVSSLNTTTLAAGNTTTFTVMFTPAAIGLRTAAIHIASNDADENPFDIKLEGSGDPNSPPTIMAQAGVARAPGSPASISQIATVNDAEDAENTLAVTINGGNLATMNGITVSGLSVSAAGQVTATIVAAANATAASFTLKVTDSGGLMATTTLTINTIPLTVKIGDPAICLDPGGLVGNEATLTNPNAGAQVSSFTATLPAGLTAVPGSCSANVNPGGCTIAANGGSVSWNGTLAAGQTVTIIYRTRIAPNVAPGAQFCIDNQGTVGNVVAGLQFCFNVICPAIVNTRVSDQKAGSVLVFPYYTSTIGGGSDTRMSVSNISNGTGLSYVHLFLMDGTSCQQSDFFLCLTPNATFGFKASDYDPGNTGYLIAVAVNAQGVPIQNNVLIGNAFVNTPQFADNYGAESFAANSFAVATVEGNAATLYFDHTGYDAVPKQFAVEIQSPIDAPGQQIVTAGLSGNLVTSQLSGAAQVGIGQAYNEKEVFASFSSWLTGACQARATISTTSPRVPNGLGILIKAGQAGSLKFNVGGGVGLLLTPRTAPWRGIRTLHKTQTTATTLTIPIFAPIC